MRTVIGAVVDFGRSWFTRFVDVQGVDRSMALAAQAFSALLPMLVVYTAIVPRPQGSDFADTLIARFELEGAAAASVRDAFTASSAVEDSLSLVGLVLLLIAALSFTRGMQRLYENAYQLELVGMRGTRAGLSWLGALAIFAAVRPVLANVFDDGVARIVVSLVLGGVLWTVTPYLLLGGRIGWRPLLPGGLLGAVGATGLAVSSVIWFPPTLTSSAEQYGVIGVAFALLSWLVAAGFVLVISTAGGAVIVDRLSRRGR